MFSNQLIKSFKKQLDEAKDYINDPDRVGLKNMKILLDVIPQSQKYHMGSDKMLQTINKIRSKYDGKQQAFMGSMANDVKLPFDRCWFDFLDTAFLSDFDEVFKGISLRVGIFVSRCNPEVDKDYPEIIQITPCFSYGPTKSWCLCGKTLFVKVGSLFNESEAEELYLDLIHGAKDNPEIISEYVKEAVNNHIIIIPTIAFNNDDDDQTKIWAEIGNAISNHAAIILNVFLVILNCQNVVTETISTTKKHKKKDPKYKGVTYKVLKFKLPKSSKRYKNKSNSGVTTMPLTLCEGHWKTYTEERPLFGKYVGRWWWPNHIRGNKEYGEVKKDYHALYDD